MIIGNIIGFMWDKGNYEKCQKHGVSIEEIEELFHREPLVFPDLKHSSDEERLIAIGKSSKERHILVVFTIINELQEKRIRPISVRYMHKKEIDRYEQENSSFPE